MHYKISATHPSARLLEIELIVTSKETVIDLFLPSWRPGRYELGNFARNLNKLKASDDKGNPLGITKTSRDSWQVTKPESSTAVIRYTYYAAQPDAGSCFVDNRLIYFNPVHCCIYEDDALLEPCTIAMVVPDDWKIATGLEIKGKTLHAKDYHQLADSPVLISPDLQHEKYEVNGIPFHIWVWGNSHPDWKKIIADFSAFTKVQLDMMQGFPVPEYHFLVLLLPYKFYHGVEHSNSTVLALGPGHALMSETLYTDFAGVASHELFHTWNVKAIRPVEMLPYRYREENYSQSGWVYEGYTTYYGDLFLARSGFFTIRGYLKELTERLQRHMDNYGKFNYSVSDSSFDTWLDGYVPGIPHRKTSIYDEGCLIALITDLFIRRHSSWEFSLDHVMQSLYKDFAMQQTGYRENDIRKLVEHYAGTQADVIFNGLIHSPVSYLSMLDELLQDTGCYVRQQPSSNIYEDLFGFRITVESGQSRVLIVAPDSPAFDAGLSKDDEIIACNGIKVENNLNEIMSQSPEADITLDVFNMRKLKRIALNKGEARYYSTYSIVPSEDAGDVQRERFRQWTGL